MAPDDNGRTSIRLLSFKVPGLPDVAMALVLQEVLEVTELGSVTEVPFAPHFLMGLSEWRGSVVTVVDMADVLCKSTSPRPASPSGSRQLVARVIANGQADAIAWSILPGASIIAAPSQAPQAKILAPLLPEGVYAAVTLAGTPHVLLNLAGIARHLMKV